MFPSGPCTRGMCDCCSRGYNDQIDNVIKDKSTQKFDKKVIINYPKYVVMVQQKGCGSCECCASDEDLPYYEEFKNFTEAEKYYQEKCRDLGVVNVLFCVELNSYGKGVPEFKPTTDPVYS